jgi:hypothetical protein
MDRVARHYQLFRSTVDRPRSSLARWSPVRQIGLSVSFAP